MFVARNIGIWKDQANTLSILDMTLLTLVFGAKVKRELGLKESVNLLALVTL